MLFALMLTTLLAASPSPTIFANGFDSPLPVGCPASIIVDGTVRPRLLTSPVGYGALLVTRPAVQLTEYVNVYGYNNAQPGPPAAWPGVTGSAPTFVNARSDSWIALHFRTPDAPAFGMAGTYVIPTAIGSPPITASISLACGDFSRYLTAPGCVGTMPASDQPFLYWHFAAPGAAACPLQPSTDYYMNIIYRDPADRARCTPTHTGVACRMPVWRGA
jgi:hypothetical protein